MNKYQEALDFLKEGAYESYSNRYIQTSKEKVYLYKSSKALQELVDKAMPRKPLKKIDINDDHNGEKRFNLYCECGKWIGAEFFKYNYCPNCGQAIDWEEE